MFKSHIYLNSLWFAVLVFYCYVPNMVLEKNVQIQIYKKLLKPWNFMSYDESVKIVKQIEQHKKLFCNALHCG